MGPQTAEYHAPMTRHSRPLPAARFLSAEPLPEALRQAASIPAYRAALDDLLPLELLTATHFMRIDGDTLWLRADSPAVATRVRQIQTRLRRGLQGRGLVAGSIKVKVGSPRMRRLEKPPLPARALPDAARRSLLAVAERLPDGPLKRAMRRLADSGKT